MLRPFRPPNCVRKRLNPFRPLAPGIRARAGPLRHPPHRRGDSLYRSEPHVTCSKDSRHAGLALHGAAGEWPPNREPRPTRHHVASLVALDRPLQPVGMWCRADEHEDEPGRNAVYGACLGRRTETTGIRCPPSASTTSDASRTSTLDARQESAGRDSGTFPSRGSRREPPRSPAVHSGRDGRRPGRGVAAHHCDVEVLHHARISERRVEDAAPREALDGRDLEAPVTCARRDDDRTRRNSAPVRELPVPSPRRLHGGENLPREHVLGPEEPGLLVGALGEFGSTDTSWKSEVACGSAN